MFEVRVRVPPDEQGGTLKRVEPNFFRGREAPFWRPPDGHLRQYQSRYRGLYPSRPRTSNTLESLTFIALRA